MMLIPCPWCGERAEPEFRFGGDPIARASLASTDEEWARYLYHHRNDKGTHSELWCHAGGCGQWFLLERNTHTHAILGATRPGAVP